MTAAIFFAIVSGIFLPCCKTKLKKETIAPGEIQIIKADEAFSAMSKQYGMKKAFMEFIDNDGILLSPNHLPAVGADAIEYLSQANDTAYTLTWHPSGAEIAASGELGFTYGIYSLVLADTTLSGTYVSIWKKQEDGKWKFILDSGNEGLQAETP